MHSWASAIGLCGYFAACPQVFGAEHVATLSTQQQQQQQKGKGCKL